MSVWLCVATSLTNLRRPRESSDTSRGGEKSRPHRFSKHRGELVMFRESLCLGRTLCHSRTNRD